MKRVATAFVLMLVGGWVATTAGQESNQPNEKAIQKLPGGTKHPAGFFEVTPFQSENGPQCDEGIIVVPENRNAKRSRNIAIQFYRIRAKNPGNHAPIFVLPGGPGGFFVRDSLKDLNTRPVGGRPVEAWVYSQKRDVILMNQRGARLPDRRYMAFRFMFAGTSLNEAFSNEKVMSSMNQQAKQQIARWQKAGMDLSGYDIMNMVEDLNDVRSALDYPKIVLRGTSFGSQWSFAYMRKYPQFVDRAVLSGIEPLDYGYDSPDGIWNVLKRLESRIEKANDQDNSLELPDVKLTDAFKAVVNRLKKSPVDVEGQNPKTKFKKKIPLGVEDFRRYLRRGINARRESAPSLERLPKYVFEIYQENYDYLAARTMQERIGFGGASLQTILIDNSLGISDARDQDLVNQSSFQWVGELNTIYKATRDVTPTPEIPDSFRTLKTDIPILMVHGDLDLSTPIENALEGIKTLSNAHLITVIGGSHNAFTQIQDHDSEFLQLVDKFLDWDLAKFKLAELNLPPNMELPPLQFQPLNKPTLFEELVKQ